MWILPGFPGPYLTLHPCLVPHRLPFGERRGRQELKPPPPPIGISRPFSAQGPGPIPVSDQRMTESPHSLSISHPRTTDSGNIIFFRSEVQFGLFCPRKQSLYLSIISTMWVYSILNNSNEEHHYYSPSDNSKPIQVHFKVIPLEGDKGKIKPIIPPGTVHSSVDKFGSKRHPYLPRRNENFPA